MNRLKVVLLAIALCTTLLIIAYTSEIKGDTTGSTTESLGSSDTSNPNPCEYAGTIKTVFIKHDLISLETTAGLIDFKYKLGDKNECIPIKDLKVGDKVKVFCKEKEEIKDKEKLIEATCVIINTTGPTFKGGSHQGGSMQ